MEDIFKQNMDIVINQIKKGGNKLMMDYYEYYWINKSLYISYIKPSIIINNTVVHKPIRILALEYPRIINVENFYMRLLRFGKQDYLNYLTYADYYHHYVCDNCDISKTGYRYKCLHCFEVDLCNECYIKNKKCITCKKEKLYKYSHNNIYPKVSKITI
jgi:hypothetical protein